jgi:hypothetical protein
MRAPIAVNTDIALVDLQGVDLSPYVDVLSVSDEPCNPRPVRAKRIVQQQVKPAKGGTR